MEAPELLELALPLPLPEPEVTPDTAIDMDTLNVAAKAGLMNRQSITGTASIRRRNVVNITLEPPEYNIVII